MDTATTLTRRLTLAAAWLLAAGAVAWVATAVIADHWIFHPLGYCTGSPAQTNACKGYNWWSGIAGSFLLGTGIWANVLATVRRHNCHVRWCWRLARHPVKGTSYVVCRRHHPEVPDRPPTAAHVHAAHQRATRRA